MSQQLTLIETAPQTTETPKGSSQTHRRFGIVAMVMTAAVLVALSLLYTQIARTVPANSDDASIVLEAADVLHGNSWLHGWTLANESFFTLDLPFHLIDVAWHGVRPRVMREVPAVVYALTVLGAVWLAGRGPGRRATGWGRAVTFILIGLPTMLMPQVLLVGVGHVATTLAMVGSLIILDVDGESGPSRSRWLGLGILCVLLVINDPMAVALFIVPTIVVSLVRHFQSDSAARVGAARRSELSLAAVTMASLLVGDIFLKVVRASGGFQVTPLTLKIVPLSDLPTNGFLLIQGLLSLFRADVFGETVDAVTLGYGIDLIGLGLVLWSMARMLCGWGGWHAGGDRVAQILSVTMAINLVAVLFDKAVFDLYKTLTSPAERYLIPFFVFGAILAGRYGIEQIGGLAWRKLIVSALGAVSVSNLAGQIQTPTADARGGLLAHWLSAHGLKYGYGNYWCSSLVAVESGDAVQIRPVEVRGGQIVEKHWFSDALWYRTAPAHFLVYDMAQVGTHSFYFDDVNLQSAIHTFGPPTETDTTNDYTVLIWDKDITPDLKR
jgi:hypothetical protein